MVTDSITQILEHFSFMDESPETFTDIDTAKARLREVINAEPVVYEAKRQSLLNQITSGVTESGITEAFEIPVEARTQLIGARGTEDIDEKFSEFEDASDIAEQLPRGKLRTKLLQQAGIGKSEVIRTKGARSRFLEEISPEVLSGRRNIWIVGKQFGFDMSNIDNEVLVRERMEELGYKVDASGRIIK